MSGFLTIAFDLSRFNAAIDQLGRDAGKAIERGVNRTLANASTAMVKVIADDMRLAQKDVRPLLRQEKASARADRWTARLYASTKAVPLIAFGATGPDPSRGRGTGVTARIGSPGRGKYPHAFIATMRSGHRGVFQRVAGGRRRGPAPSRSQLPIYELHGPSIAHVFTRHQQVAEARANEMLLQNLQHEFDFLLSQLPAAT